MVMDSSQKPPTLALSSAGDLTYLRYIKSQNLSMMYPLPLGERGLSCGLSTLGCFHFRHSI